MSSGIDIGNYGSERFARERRADEVNFYPPTRVVAAFDVNAIVMFPFTIALLSVPALQCFESIHKFVSETPSQPARHPLLRFCVKYSH